jgi:hypothetical protein
LSHMQSQATQPVNSKCRPHAKVHTHVSMRQSGSAVGDGGPITSSARDAMQRGKKGEDALYHPNPETCNCHPHLPKLEKLVALRELSKTLNNQVRRRLSVLRGDISGNQWQPEFHPPLLRKLHMANSPLSVLPLSAGVPMITSGNCKWERARQNTRSEQVDCLPSSSHDSSAQQSAHSTARQGGALFMGSRRVLTAEPF